MEALTSAKDSNLQQIDKSICVMKPISAPRYDGGNLIVDLDGDEYIKVLKTSSLVW